MAILRSSFSTCGCLRRGHASATGSFERSRTKKPNTEIQKPTDSCTVSRK